MSPDQSVTLVVPARYASSRFPGKPLTLLAGKPLIQHVYECAAAAHHIDRVFVATDDPRIRDTVEGFGGTVVMTAGSVRTGTDRVAEVAELVPGAIFVNLQGDELPLHPGMLSDLVPAFRASGAGMGSLKRRLRPEDDLHNPAVVKVVTNHQDDALYFSRAPIPYRRDEAAGQGDPELHYIHLGVYIYTRETLMRIAGLPTGRLEDTEKLEQLRALEHGIPIRIWETAYPSLRIDRPEDVAPAEAALQRLVPCHGTVGEP